MGISTFIILKNEAQTLLRTLRSAAKFSEEIIIGVDDSTTDRSIDVIGEFLPEFGGEVEIFEFRWNDSFAEARNRAICKCTKEWIFQLDAHEYIRPGDEEKLRELTEKLPQAIWLVALEMWDEWQDGQPNSRFYQDHLWRSGKGIVYTGAMHNYISKETCPPEHRVKVPGIVIYHQRTSENDIARKIQRLEMAKKVFISEIERNPSDLRSIFYLAQTYLNSELLDDAERYYLMYIETSAKQGIPNPSEQAWAYYKTGLIAAAREDNVLAVDSLLQGLKYRADSPEIYLALGEAFLRLGKTREAERFLIISANTLPEADHLFGYGAALTYGPWLRLMQLYFDRGDYSQAFRAGMEGLRKTPESKPLLEGVCASLANAAAKIETPDSSKKNLYVVNSTSQSDGRLSDEWRKEYNTIVHAQVDYAHMQWADLTFVDGGNRNLLEAAQHKFKCPIVARIHHRDIYRPFFKHIDWENVDTLVFTSEQVRDAAIRITGKLPCKTAIIERGIDTEKYTLLKETDPLSLAWIGDIHWRENLSFLLELLSETEEPYILNVAGEFQDEEYKDIILCQIKTLGLEKRVVFHGRQNDLNTFLEEIKPRSIVSSSMSADQPTAVLIAMAKGIQPIVYQYRGAKKELLPEVLFKNWNEFHKNLRKISKNASYWKQYIIEDRSFKKKENSISDIFFTLLNKSEKIGIRK